MWRRDGLILPSVGLVIVVLGFAAGAAPPPDAAAPREPPEYAIGTANVEGRIWKRKVAFRFSRARVQAADVQIDLGTTAAFEKKDCLLNFSLKPGPDGRFFTGSSVNVGVVAWYSDEITGRYLGGATAVLEKFGSGPDVRLRGRLEPREGRPPRERRTDDIDVTGSFDVPLPPNLAATRSDWAPPPVGAAKVDGRVEDHKKVAFRFSKADAVPEGVRIDLGTTPAFARRDCLMSFSLPAGPDGRFFQGAVVPVTAFASCGYEVGESHLMPITTVTLESFGDGPDARLRGRIESHAGPEPDKYRSSFVDVTGSFDVPIAPGVAARRRDWTPPPASRGALGGTWDGKPFVPKSVFVTREKLERGAERFAVVLSERPRTCFDVVDGFWDDALVVRGPARLPEDVGRTGTVTPATVRRAPDWVQPPGEGMPAWFRLDRLDPAPGGKAKGTIQLWSNGKYKAGHLSGGFEGVICPPRVWAFRRGDDETVTPFDGVKPTHRFGVAYSYGGPLEIELANEEITCKLEHHGPGVEYPAELLEISVPPGPEGVFLDGRASVPVAVTIKRNPCETHVSCDDQLPAYVASLQFEPATLKPGQRLRGRLRWNESFDPRLTGREPRSFVEDFEATICPKGLSGSRFRAPVALPGPKAVRDGPVAGRLGDAPFVAKSALAFVSDDVWVRKRYVGAVVLSPRAALDCAAARDALDFDMEEREPMVTLHGNTIAAGLAPGSIVPVNGLMTDRRFVWRGHGYGWVRVDALDLAEGGHVKGLVFAEGWVVDPHGPAPRKSRVEGAFDAKVCLDRK